MKSVGIRELRRDTRGLLRRVAAGETIEVTDRGRPVAIVLRSLPTGLTRLEQVGLLRRAEGDLLAIKPLRLPRGAMPPSDLVAEGRRGIEGPDSTA